MEYTPHPIDLSDIELDTTIKKDIEKIAKNIHEAWGEQRRLQGWKYGESYDAKQKTHPCMIEYDILPEPEKDIDRATVTQTIKTLLSMGYTIEKEHKL